MHNRLLQPIEIGPRTVEAAIHEAAQAITELTQA